MLTASLTGTRRCVKTVSACNYFVRVPGFVTAWGKTSRANMSLDNRTPRLMPKQRELLGLTILAGSVTKWSGVPAQEAWTLRLGGDGHPSVVMSFAKSVGKKLVALGYLEIHPDPEMRDIPAVGQSPRRGRRYVVTPAGVARARAAADIAE
jgi:hypothetical protein